MTLFISDFVFKLSFLLFVLIYIPVKSDNDEQLPFIKNYDNVFYDSNLIHNRHMRVSRSLDSYLYINFNSLNKTFKLKLKPTKSLFEHDFIEINNKPIATNNYLFYDGYLTDDPRSYASGSIIDGVFYGSIKTNDGVYYIESSKKYIKNNTEFKSESIIYHENDVIFDINNSDQNRNRTKRSVINEHAGCASDDTYKWMKDIQREAYETNVKNEIIVKVSNDSLLNQKSYSKNNKKRVRRQSFPSDQNVCSLYLKVDPFFYKEIYNNEGNKDSQKTSSFILSYLQAYVGNLNSIYSTVKFYNSEKSIYYDGLNFKIHRVKIITDEMCNNGELIEADRKLCTQYLDVASFLSYASLDNYSEYCLGFVFSGRDFSDGTLGLAWIAKPSGSIGGICEKYQTIQNVNRSLNGGILTIMNYQVRVPESAITVTFSHEIGHSFGAEHDPSNITCMPGDENGGNYIMYSQATTGRKPNNRLFSECSINQMSAVVSALITNGKLCFIAKTTSLCGNMIVEEGEECDCGYLSDCKESCCNHAEVYPEETRCKLKPEAVCSPSQGPCCNTECQFSSENEICFNRTDCSYDVKCSGNSALCPKDNPIYFNDNDTYGNIKDCNDGTQICRNGTCTGSICEKYGLTQCYLEGNLQNKTTNRTALCHLYCQGTSTSNICKDSFEIPLFNNKTKSNGFILKPGSTCAGTQGYCDIFSRCRAANEEGPLSKLEKILVNSNLLNDFKSWISTYWWAILIGFIGILVLTGTITYLSSLCIPTSNPKKAVNKKV